MAADQARSTQKLHACLSAVCRLYICLCVVLVVISRVGSRYHVSPCPLCPLCPHSSPLLTQAHEHRQHEHRQHEHRQHRQHEHRHHEGTDSMRAQATRAQATRDEHVAERLAARPQYLEHLRGPAAALRLCRQSEGEGPAGAPPPPPPLSSRRLQFHPIHPAAPKAFQLPAHSHQSNPIAQQPLLHPVRICLGKGEKERRHTMVKPCAEVGVKSAQAPRPCAGWALS